MPNPERVFTRQVGAFRRAFGAVHARVFTVPARRDTSGVIAAVQSVTADQECVPPPHKATWRVKREKPRTAADKQPIFLRAELNLVHSRVRGPRIRMHARPLDLPPPVSPPVRPPACHFASRSVVCCVVAKATVEVGLALPLSSPRVVVTQRARRLDRRCRQCWPFHHRLRDAHCLFLPFD